MSQQQDPIWSCGLCTRQGRLPSGPIGFKNKCGRVGLGSSLISSGLSRFGFILKKYCIHVGFG